MRRAAAYRRLLNEQCDIRDGIVKLFLANLGKFNETYLKRLPRLRPLHVFGMSHAVAR